MKQIMLSMLALVLALGAGCTFPSANRRVPRSQVGVLQTLDTGRVTQVRMVEIDGEKTLLGLSGGAAIGGAAAYPGSGPSTGQVLAQAGAAVVGAVVGQAVEEVATRRQGQEITVLLDNGATVVIVQETEDGVFQEGDRVQVHSGGGGNASVRMAL